MPGLLNVHCLRSLLLLLLLLLPMRMQLPPLLHRPQFLRSKTHRNM